MISVYGGTGFIGSRFCELYKNDVYMIPRNQRSPDSLEILYLISTNHNYNVFDHPFLDINTNLRVLIETLEACKQYEAVTFNFVSSWFVYGDTPLPAREDSPCNPKGFYSITKRCAEQLLISYCETFGIRWRIFRLANVYGVRDKFSAQKNALQFLIRKLLNGDSIELYYGGDFQRDYIHIDDVCRIMRGLIEKAPLGEIFNIGSGVGYNFGGIIEFVKDFIFSKSEITDVDPSEFHRIVQVKDMWLDVNKIRKLGFEKKISMKDGLKEVIESMR